MVASHCIVSLHISCLHPVCTIDLTLLEILCNTGVKRKARGSNLAPHVAPLLQQPARLRHHLVSADGSSEENRKPPPHPVLLCAATEEIISPPSFGSSRQNSSSRSSASLRSHGEALLCPSSFQELAGEWTRAPAPDPVLLCAATERLVSAPALFSSWQERGQSSSSRSCASLRSQGETRLCPLPFQQWAGERAELLLQILHSHEKAHLCPLPFLAVGRIEDRTPLLDPALLCAVTERPVSAPPPVLFKAVGKRTKLILQILRFSAQPWRGSSPPPLLLVVGRREDI